MSPKKQLKTSRMKRSPDPMRLEIFKNIFHSIAEEMGAALRRSAFSPNIKERRDYSCAVYDGHGQVLAMGDHMPVHLGSMPASVAAARDAFDFSPGDIAILNDPFAGGTHLPDLTLVMPVFVPKGAKPQFFVASRASADIGAGWPMGPAREIFRRVCGFHPSRYGSVDECVKTFCRDLANVRTPR
jgi:N-methylhydantoinase B